MPRFTYHKHRPNLWEDLDLSELVNAMSEFLLGSGFGEPADGDNQTSQQDLKDAITNALMTSNLLPDEDLQKLFSSEETLNEFLEKVIERLMNEGFIQASRNGTGSMDDSDGQGETGGSGAPVKFELSEKGTDFLGYRALRDLMGAFGRSSFGSHDTQDLSTGVDASGPSKPYEFGDTMNLDVSETLLNTIRRTRALDVREGEGLDVGYEDLVVRQTEYRSSCATVVCKAAVIVTYGMGVYWAKAAAKEFPGRVTIIDLRTLVPMDEDAVMSSVREHARCLVVTEEQLTNSFAQALAGRINGQCFRDLDAPVRFIGAIDMPAVPLNSTLEAAMIPSAEKVAAVLGELLRY